MPMQRYEAELLLDLKMTLGEGPLWDFNRQQLFFVDIEGRCLYQYDPNREHVRAYSFDRMTTAVSLLADGALLLAQEDRLLRFVPETSAIYPLTDLEADEPANRSNDAKVGPDNRYYVGTMARDGKQRVGSLYQVDAHWQVEEVLCDCTISNGMAWSADARTFYYIDSPTHEVRAFDFNPDTGALTNERTAVRIPAEQGVPDGMTIDTEGHLWVAHHGGGCVACYDPRDGSLVRDIKLPAPLVTSCAFGGADLDTLYITTAREGMTEADIQKYPHSGGLFRVRTGQRGRPEPMFRPAQR